MAMLDDIKATEQKAAEMKEKAEAQAKEYAAASEFKSAADREALLEAARSEAALTAERAAEEAAAEGEALLSAGRAADRELVAEAEKKLNEAADAVFAKLGE